METSDLKLQAARTPGKTATVLRAIAAFFSAWMAMMIVVTLFHAGVMIVQISTSHPQLFQKYQETGSDPAKVAAAMESGEIPRPGKIFLVLSLVADFLGAFAGGFVCAWIAARANWQHAIVLAVVMTAFSIFYAATSKLEAILPTWVPWTRALVCIPLGVLLGASWRLSRNR